ncbi:MAG TPA: sigma-70 family RNA polymerase sigma factor [Natronosporangium sp.]|nr:sigma-70 family RNA polymerase sigma factor [Natronosporangium sp.]
MNDRALVAALVAGDPAGLAGTYDAYADQVYAYCQWLLDDPEAAGEATVDTFVVARARSDRLRQPERLRGWLYAIARSQCLGSAQLRRRGADQLEPDQWELHELVDRHGLPVAEAGAVLGLPSHRVRQLLAKARGEREPDRGSVALAVEPVQESFPPAPALLWPRLELRALEPGLAPEREAVLRRVGRLGPHGFPRPWRVRRRRRLALVAGLTTGALVLVGGGAAAVNAAAFTAAAPPPPPPQPVPTTVAGVAAPTTAAAETPTPAPTPLPSETLVPAPPPTPPPPEPTAPPEPTRRPDPVVPALTVTADVEVECARWFRDAHRLRVTATGSEPLHTAELHLSGRWHTSLPMEIDGDTARVRTDWLVSRGRYEWWVEVGTESATAATGPVEIRQPCD